MNTDNLEIIQSSIFYSNYHINMLFPRMNTSSRGFLSAPIISYDFTKVIFISTSVAETIP